MDHQQQTIRTIDGPPAADNQRKNSWKNKPSLERWHCGATGSGMDKDSKGQRKLER